MNKSKNLANRLQEVLLDGKWIAKTNIQEQLKRINLKEANYKLGDHNTIAELTYHINYYLGGILDVLRGGDLKIRDQYSFDMEKVTSESDWQELIDAFNDNSHSIVEMVQSFPDERWDDSFVQEIYGTYERNIEGLIEHSYYHFGQITLIIKLIKEKNALA